MVTVHEVVQSVTTPRGSRHQYWAELRHIPGADVNFRHFLIARWTYALGSMGIGFVTVAAIHRWTVGIVSFLAPLLGTSLAGVSYGLLFALGGVVNLVGLLLLPFYGTYSNAPTSQAAP